MNTVFVFYDKKFRNQVFPELVPLKYFSKYTEQNIIYKFLRAAGIFRSEFFLLLGGDEVQACVVLRKRPGLTPLGMNWFIYGVAVKKEMRGKGLGSILIKNLLDYCRTKKMKRFFLYVDFKNEAAVNLYLKNGFKILKIFNSDRRKRHSGEYLMKKDF
ncbi:MAG TPA: GNAT family N-acetyltransferase [Bacteroidales bacterium]|nr:GNAT family N-acetyltransferase [Bacteroidales bacterium]